MILSKIDFLNINTPTVDVMTELALEIVSFTSEEEKRPAQNLNRSDLENPGWQSVPYEFNFFI